VEARLALPARDPDRKGDQGRAKRARALPAGAPAALRAAPSHGLRAGAHRGGGAAESAGGEVIVTPGAVARLVLIVIFTVALQVSGVQGVSILGGNADLIPLVVAAVALWGGCIPGAAIGFACGLLIDLVLGQDVGS